MDHVLESLAFLPPPWARYLAYSAVRRTPLPAAIRRVLGDDVAADGHSSGGRHAA